MTRIAVLAFQVGQKESPLAVGLRDHSMRTPGQLQQNYPGELALSDAAAAAGLDAIEFRLRQTDDPRLIGVLKAVRDASGWQTRSAPSPTASATGSAKVTGQGVSALLRSGTYWACVCHVSVVPGTGKVSVDKYTIAVDPGIVVNPLQLKRQIEGGALMGLSHALYEEVTFDESNVTSRDWRSYPILTMADVPEIEILIDTFRAECVLLKSLTFPAGAVVSHPLVLESCSVRQPIPEPGLAQPRMDREGRSASRCMEPCEGAEGNLRRDPEGSSRET